MKTINTNLGQAIIDFANFEEAKHYATQNGMEIRLFSQRDGHDSWTCHGLAYQAMKLTDWNWGCEADAPYYSGEEYIKANPAPFEGDELDEEELAEQEAWISMVKEIASKIDLAVKDGEFAVVYNSEVVETYPIESMMYHDNDVTFYAVGCIK